MKTTIGVLFVLAILLAPSLSPAQSGSISLDLNFGNPHHGYYYYAPPPPVRYVVPPPVRIYTYDPRPVRVYQYYDGPPVRYYDGGPRHRRHWDKHSWKHHKHNRYRYDYRD